MAPKNRIIIDTDPGVDDVLALLLALSAPASELETLLISVSFGNVDVRACTRNVVAIFQVLDQEIEWRKQQGLPVGFEGVTKFKPLVAIGATESLHDRSDKADDFHGADGLGGVHSTHPHLSPQEGWEKVFEKPSADHHSAITKAVDDEVDLEKPTTSFTPSYEPAHKEILRLLRENEADTITLISIGPLTNFALAAAEDPVTFLRAKQVVTMGGAVENFGNVTPVAEFNVAADPTAAARIYALSSPNPASTTPKIYTETLTGIPMPQYPANLGKQQKTILMSLDITEYHVLSRKQLTSVAGPLSDQGSPLAQWTMVFMKPMLDKMERLHLGHEGEGAALALHDPLTVWYVLTEDVPGWKASDKSPEDIRVETEGRWTKGMTVGDRRLRKRRNSEGERPYDRDDWLGNQSGNRIYRMLESPGRDQAAIYLLESIFGKKPT